MTVKYKGADDMRLTDNTADFVEDFKQNLIDRHISRFTISTYTAAMQSTTRPSAGANS